MPNIAMTRLLRRNMDYGGHGRLRGDVVRARVPGDQAGIGDLFLTRKRVLLMAIPELKTIAEQITDGNGEVTFDYLKEGKEFAAFTRAAKLPDGNYVIGDYWDRLFPGPMP